MPTYFITGTNRGIGLEYVKQLSASPDNTIFATVRSLSSETTELKALNKNDNIHIIQCDLSSKDSIAGVTKSLPAGTKINFIINNAGLQGASGTSALSLPWEMVLSHITNNALGPAKLVEILLPFLAEGGVVVNISSGMGSLGLQATTTPDITPHILPYGISKAALNMLSIHQAHELKGKATVVCFDPGHVKTTMGGPNAPTEIHDSAAGILKVVHGLKAEDSGKFFHYSGKELPW